MLLEDIMQPYVETSVHNLVLGTKDAQIPNNLLFRIIKDNLLIIFLKFSPDKDICRYEYNRYPFLLNGLKNPFLANC